MKNMLRGMALSIMFYCVIMGIISLTIYMGGGKMSDIPMGVFIGVGACCGILSSIVNEKLD